MAILDIITYPDKRLRQVALPVLPELADASPFSSEKSVVDHARDMVDTLVAARSGLALAATQVGVPWRIVVFREPGAACRVALNPVIDVLGKDVSLVEEGCLSFPDFGRRLLRSSSVEVSYESLDLASGKRERVEGWACGGVMAQMWQHELQHLDGKTFVDDLPKAQRERIAMQVILTKGRWGR